MRNPFSAVCFLLSRLLDSYGLNPHQENNTILDDILGTDSSTPLVINKGIIRLKNAPALKLATAGSLADVSWQNKSVAQAKDHLIAITESLCTKAPCILAVDDANYMDTLSWELLDKFGQLTSQYPCVVALTSIPHSERVQQPLQIQKINGQGCAHCGHTATEQGVHPGLLLPEAAGQGHTQPDTTVRRFAGPW
ncbi:hypothetical protein MRX96_050014 [Rhipicephalus microplus]